MSLFSAARRPFAFPGSGIQFTPLHVLPLLLVAGLAWAWSADRAMGSMPGTMGRDAISFIGMWTPMMTAMMLPSAAPFASMHARTFASRRVPRLAAFALGYIAVWAATGVPAFGLALLMDEVVSASSTAGTVMAVAIFAGCGIYQLTPLKGACLSHCRSPIGQLAALRQLQGRNARSARRPPSWLLLPRLLLDADGADGRLRLHEPLGDGWHRQRRRD